MYKHKIKFKSDQGRIIHLIAQFRGFSEFHHSRFRQPRFTLDDGSWYRSIKISTTSLWSRLGVAVQR